MISVDELVPIHGGYRVKDVGTHWVDVVQMMYGWRLLLVPKEMDQVVDGAWCYFGSGVDQHGNQRHMEQAFVGAVLAAQAWDGEGSPAGYDKVAGA